MTRALISIGGNLGNVYETLSQASHSINHAPSTSLQKVSQLYRTRPMGHQAGNEFLNGCWLIDTNLDPLPLLDQLQAIESQFGRQRTLHWGPRTIDLDLVAWGDSILNLPRLTLPHPGCWYRRFVLDPLAEIAPDWVHPLWNLSLLELLNHLSCRPLQVELVGVDSHLIPEIQQQLRSFESRFILHANNSSSPRIEPAFRLISQRLLPSQLAGESAKTIPWVQIGTPTPSKAKISASDHPDENALIQEITAILTAALDQPEPTGLIPLVSAST